MNWWKGFQAPWGKRPINVEDRFELIREAAAGTMSRFYMARDLKLDRIVGLKLLDGEKTKKFESRFSRLNKPTEGEIASHFLHPGIVETLEYGKTTTGIAYLLMEYLDGQGMNTLIHVQDDLFDQHRQQLLTQMASALNAVHAAGYIHRDFCPRNLIVAKDRMTVKLIDFGLSLPDRPEFRRPGNRTGTPLYMSPEIVRRKATDHRVDIFSFGVSAYEMYAGALPWSASVVTGRAAMEHDKPPTPIENHCPDLDQRLVQLIHRCIAADPVNRPQSMEEVETALTQMEGKDA